MRRHETPLAIARALARHAPQRLRRVIDPAVGNGVLLEPFFRRSRGNFKALALDSDSRPLKRLRLKFGNLLSFIHADFLGWATSYVKRDGELFDCVVMNPPFAGRRHRWRPLLGLRKLLGLDWAPDFGPIEAGFVLGAISLLRPGGRLLAVLPASLMTSPSATWVRRVLVSTGAILHVHELPRFAFPEIEGRIYLVVYEKGSPQRKTVLLNHDLDHPEKLVIAKEVIVTAERLDFRYHSAAARLEALRKRASLVWHKVGDLGMVWRGTEPTPGQAESVIHTGDFHEGFWRKRLVHSAAVNVRTNRPIRTGDVLVKRVSRHCARSFGLGVEINGALASDCLLVIRPYSGVSSVRMLFAIRCLMASDCGSSLVERGTGATYMAQGELAKLEIPYGLSSRYRRQFQKYASAVRLRNFETMQRIELDVSSKLLATDFCK